ncbi:MAG: NrtA/SsuA/CpmA family ABC transporter substrate-binding protein [Alphaproteobacteria bacterium]|nr:NrtA/SsuA/CpmA family ABC transporter substrate-binding protein [Alphaproteobacteria bacterium]
MKTPFRLLAATAAVLCLGAPVAHAEGKPAKVVVSHVTSPFNVPSIVMQRTGMLEKAFAADGIKVELPEITSGAKQVQALAAGSLDIAGVLGGTSAIIGRANGAEVVIVAAYSRNAEAFFVMSLAKGPATIESLKGKTVAGPKGTTLNQLLVAALASRRMTLADVSYINMDLPAARAALLAGKVDAATLAGNHSLAVEAAGGKVIASGKGLIQPTTVIAVNKAFLDKHPAQVERFLAVHRDAVDFVARNRAEALKLAAEEQKISLADAARMLAWYDFSPVMTDADIANLNADQDFMLESRMIERRIDIRKDLVHPMAFRQR